MDGIEDAEYEIVVYQGVSLWGGDTPFSQEMLSNLYTMSHAEKVDKRQAIPEKPYTIPELSTRLLRARLLMEECLETISALGLHAWHNGHSVGCGDFVFTEFTHTAPDLNGIIDGCVDVIYVATGTLAACGVPDIPHLEEVSKCNNAKFANGAVVVNGKYQKPEGWVGPDHDRVREEVLSAVTDQ